MKLRYAYLFVVFVLTFFVINVSCECIPNWQCSDWVITSYGKTRTCVDLNNCGLPVPMQDCIESWSCGSWSSCINGQITRICVDDNNCGTDVYKPSTSLSCTTYQDEDNEIVYLSFNLNINKNISIKIDAPNEIEEGKKFNITAVVNSSTSAKNLTLVVNDKKEIFNISKSKKFYFEFTAPHKEKMIIEVKLSESDKIIFSDKITIPIIYKEEMQNNIEKKNKENDYKFIFIFIIIIILLAFIKARVAKSGQRR